MSNPECLTCDDGGEATESPEAGYWMCKDCGERGSGRTNLVAKRSGLDLVRRWFGMKYRDKLAASIPLLIAPIYVAVSFTPVINEIGLVSPSVFAVIGFVVLVLKRKACSMHTGVSQ